MIYDYDLEKVYTKSVEIDDPGNCSLVCRDLEGNAYYYKTQSVNGFVYALKFGPVIEGFDFLDPDQKKPFSLDYHKFKYSNKAVDNEFTKFVNDMQKGIVEVEEISVEELLEQVPPADRFIAA